jgi:hypothetical protein
MISGFLPSEVYTTVPRGRNSPATDAASATLPPPLSRRSSRRPAHAALLEPVERRVQIVATLSPMNVVTRT